MSTARAMDVQVTVRARLSPRIGRARVERSACAMLRALGLGEAELSILLCDDREIHALNRDWRHKDKPTDVLAFALREGKGGEHAGHALGDVVISVETAKRQAVSAKHPVFSEVSMLLAHGLLHLIGWDHATEAADRKMRREVERLLEASRAVDVTRAPRSVRK